MTQQSSEAGGLASETKTGLRLKQEFYTISDKGQRCKRCGEMLASDAVLCIQCGQLTRGKGRLATAMPRGWTRRLAVAAVVVIAVIAVAAGVVQSKLIGTFRTKVADARETVEQKRSVEAQKREDALRARLDEQFPLLREGDYADLRGVNGAVIQGRIAAVATHAVQIETAKGVRTVGMAELDLASRLRFVQRERDRLVARSATNNPASTLETALEYMNCLLAPAAETGAEAVPEAPAVDRAEAEAKALESARLLVDQKYPLFRTNAAVSIVQRNGIVRNGVLQSAAGNALAIEMEGLGLVTVPYEQLRNEDLVRVSERHRSNLVQKLARKIAGEAAPL